MELNKKIDIVRGIMLDYPDTRENDNLLTVHYWMTENEGLRKPYETGYTIINFLVEFKRGRYTKPETITRLRRLVENRYPELRGEKYVERHTSKEERVRADITKQKVRTLFDVLGEITDPKPMHRE